VAEEAGGGRGLRRATRWGRTCGTRTTAIGGRHVDAALLALSRRWDAARPVVLAAARRTRTLAGQAALLALAGLAVACLAGRRYAARGAALVVSLLSSGYALARRHYPAARSRVASAATLATATGAGVAWLLLAADAAVAAVRDGSAFPQVNGLVGEKLGRCTWGGLALWDASGRVRARLTLAGLTAALGVGLAFLGAVWDSVR
jgi:hypothetical protein